MNITQLRRGNSQFPHEKEIGDVVVMASGDMFCWDGQMWQLLGGRFLPSKFRIAFLDYIRDGFPDPLSALFDMSVLFDMQDLFLEAQKSGSEEELRFMEKASSFDFVEKFKDRIVTVAEKCEEALGKQIL